MITAQQAAAVTETVIRQAERERLAREKKSLEQWKKQKQAVVEELSKEIIKAANKGLREARFQYEINDQKASNNWKYLILILENNDYTVVQDAAGHMTNEMIVTQKVTW